MNGTYTIGGVNFNSRLMPPLSAVSNMYIGIQISLNNGLKSDKSSAMFPRTTRIENIGTKNIFPKIDPRLKLFIANSAYGNEIL